MIDANVSFLDKLEINYEDFRILNYEIEVSYLPPIFKKTVGKILNEKAPSYKENCQGRNKAIEDISQIKLKKDTHGDLYLMITGADYRTNLVIRKNQSDYAYYKQVPAVKVMEAEFLAEADNIQLKELEDSKLSKRFLKDEKDVPAFNALKELGIKDLIPYILYLRNEMIENKAVYSQYDEGEASAHNKNKALANDDSYSYERANEILDKTKRYEELNSYNPLLIIRATGRQTGAKSMVFIYKKDNYYIGFMEPESGESFSKVIFINNTDDIKEIKDIILDKLSYNEKEIGEDNTMIRSAHTSLETFKGNLAYLFNKYSQDSSLSFRQSVNNVLENFEIKRHLPKV